MPDEEIQPFYERFKALLQTLNLTPEQAAVSMGVKIDVVRRLLDGRTAQMKLDEALRLCQEYGVDPWFLAFGRVRQPAISGAEKAKPAPNREARFDNLEREVAEIRQAVGRIRAVLKQQSQQPKHPRGPQAS